jgi:hypothetical protein
VGVRRALADNEELGESPLWPSLALFASAGLYADLVALRWVVPALTIVLLLTLGIIRPTGRLARVLDWEPRTARLTPPASRARGDRDRQRGQRRLDRAADPPAHQRRVCECVTAASRRGALWVVNVLLFALWYWQLDGGGPMERPQCAPDQRDVLFAQQTEAALQLGGWRPLFLDYLYLSFTNASAFSPTDTLPLSRWAKMLMLVQSAISLALAVMVVARAVNILQTK